MVISMPLDYGPPPDLEDSGAPHFEDTYDSDAGDDEED